MAIFAGYDLGMIEEIETFPNEKGRQINSYPGVNGLEILDHGTRGLRTTVRGVILAPDLPTLSADKQLLGGFVLDGGQYAMLDDDGTLWTNVILVKFQPTGRRFVLAGLVGVAQRYEAEFLHNSV